MLIGFLIKSFEDWREWRTAVSDVAGKPLVHVADIGPVPNDHYDERRNAIDEVETIDDEYESDGESCEYLR